MDGPHGPQVFTLQSADQPYRMLVERMNEGAATLTAAATILFCNRRLSEMVGLPAERLLGIPFISLLRDGSQENFSELLRLALLNFCAARFVLEFSPSPHLRQRIR